MRIKAYSTVRLKGSFKFKKIFAAGIIFFTLKTIVDINEAITIENYSVAKR